ncbi:late competence development ComFB family protein [Defluviitalea saccharophila]|uniref:Late competence development ComFB family protein n=1 Tax=Defluviitalea saccharophila TaxID=879970 RepID=A0ABZ2Y7L2_9FIRM|nr:late competence development ComFB family protein [Candidatus Epulonipiscium sp.]
MLEIRNYMEDLVFAQLDGVVRDVKVCDCEKCKMDVAAIALNSLQPHYIVTAKGRLYTKLNTLQQQFDVDVLSAIIKAAILVKRNPQHEQDE